MTKFVESSNKNNIKCHITSYLNSTVGRYCSGIGKRIKTEHLEKLINLPRPNCRRDTQVLLGVVNWIVELLENVQDEKAVIAKTLRKRKV